MAVPKVFISYSWNDQAHQKKVLMWADRLIGDGVDVVLDQYDLKEGQDKYVFMERMVTDSSITHVLMICDDEYSKKADLRKSGVGTESQIISREIYEKVDQTKFIPIVCQVSENGHPCLPEFMKSRIWIDFSTEESVNENWERLIRLLHGKPALQKPQLGTIPAYLSEESERPADPLGGKFSILKQAILQRKTGIKIYRKDFLDTCFSYSDSLRVREAPSGNIAEKVLDNFMKLRPVRNSLIDWIALEIETQGRSKHR